MLEVEEEEEWKKFHQVIHQPQYQMDLVKVGAESVNQNICAYDENKIKWLP